MEHIILKARAKINLALDVVGKRADGYHELKMIMQTLELHDVLFIKKTASPEIKISCNYKWIPTDERNLVYKATRLMVDKFNLKCGFSFDLGKRIPVAAGLAGGSSDCAAALVGIRKLCGLQLTDKELMQLGKTLGADVPYCIMRGTALAEGIGDRLTPLTAHPPVFVLLVKMPFCVSTASVFKSLNLDGITHRPNIDKMIRDLDRGNLKDICAGFSNVLETVTLPKHPEIGDVKRLLMESGAEGALMSGSGPSVFAYFTERGRAINAVRNVRRSNIRVRDIYLTRVFNTKGVGI